MPSREVYNSKLNQYGTNQRDRTVTMAQKDIAKNVISSPSYKKVLINEAAERFLEITATQNDNRKRFTTMPNEVVLLGDIISWNGMHWLITQVDFDDEIVMRGEIEQCNREIKWQNPVTKEIISRWCFAERPYATGINEGKVVSVPDRAFRVKLPYDSETIQVDIGKRVVLEVINGKQKTYELEMPDLNTNKFQDSEGGFIVWNLKFSSDIDPLRDNLELGICNYIEPDTPPLPPVNPDPTFLKCEIVGRDSIRIGGSARPYNAKFYGTDGVTEITDGSVIAKWDISLPAGLEKYFEITQNANSVLIKVSDCEALIGENISLKLSDDNRIYNSVMLNIDLVVM